MAALLDLSEEDIVSDLEDASIDIAAIVEEAHGEMKGGEQQ